MKCWCFSFLGRRATVLTVSTPDDIYRGKLRNGVCVTETLVGLEERTLAILKMKVLLQLQTFYNMPYQSSLAYCR